MPLPFAAWILAGGRSRRMGVDKALLDLDRNGQPLFLRALERLRPVADSVTLIGDPVKYADLNINVIRDLRPDSGPLAGIETALTLTAFDWNAIVACDLPDFDPAVFLKMADAMPDGIEAVVPRHEDGRLEPLCAMYHRRALPKITPALDGGTLRVLSALETLTLRYFPVDDAKAFRNLNTPEDVDHYRNG